MMPAATHPAHQSSSSNLGARRGHSPNKHKMRLNRRNLFALMGMASFAVLVIWVQLQTPLVSDVMYNQPLNNNHNDKKIRHSSVSSATSVLRGGNDNPLLRWNTLTLSGMWKVLDCDDLFQSSSSSSAERPILTQEAWTWLRRVYVQTVGAQRSTLGNPQSGGNGFSQPIVAKQAGGTKGRGLFAASHIPKGALIWSNHRTAMFADGASFRNFVKKLPVDAACDILQWAYVYTPPFTVAATATNHDQNTTSTPLICIDLDEGSLCNDVDDPKKDDWNLGADPERGPKLLQDVEERGNGMHLFAKRDIDKGEELLCNYDEFIDGRGWKPFGL